MTYRLHYYPGNASFAPHVLLDKSGAAYELILVDRTVQAHKAPDYLALNPAGRIPAFQDGDMTLFESAAICLYLLDRHPSLAPMMPPSGSPARGLFYKWLVFMTNTIQPEFLSCFYADRYTDDPNAVPSVKAKAEERLNGWWDILDDAVADGRPYLLGDALGAADIYMAMMGRWGRKLARPPGTLPHLGPMLHRIMDDPDIKRIYEKEGITAPLL